MYMYLCMFYMHMYIYVPPLAVIVSIPFPSASPQTIHFSKGLRKVLFVNSTLHTEIVPFVLAGASSLLPFCLQISTAAATIQAA